MGTEAALVDGDPAAHEYKSVRCVPYTLSEHDVELVLRGTHQFGLVPDVDSLAERLVQLLDRIPKGSQVRLHPGGQHHMLHDSAVLRALELCERDGVLVVEGGESAADEYVIYFDLPADTEHFLDRLRQCKGTVRTYTLLCKTVGSLRMARESMGKVLQFALEYASAEKAAELKSAMGQITSAEEDVENSDGEGDGCAENDDDCVDKTVIAGNLWPPYNISDDLEAMFQEHKVEKHDCCALCTSISTGGAKVTRREYGQYLEVVCIDMSAVVDGCHDDFKALKDLARPEREPSYTIIVLHFHGMHDLRRSSLKQYLPAADSERARVIFLNGLKDRSGVPSWHDYPDEAMMDETLGEDCGCSWLDILDSQTAPGGWRGLSDADQLLKQLVELETEWLRGRSDRIILMGSSQGGGMAFFHFLNSRVLLGGFVGSVCHPPIAPHVPRRQDPLLHDPVNRHRPVCLQSAKKDTCFALGLVHGDLMRLREVGGFTQIDHRIEDDLDHYMGDDPDRDLKYLHDMLPFILKD